MAKIDPRKTIQKRRTEEEMRQALHDFMIGAAGGSMPPQDDDTDIILLDAIAELLELRQLIEELKGFAQAVTIKTARK